MKPTKTVCQKPRKPGSRAALRPVRDLRIERLPKQRPFDEWLSPYALQRFVDAVVDSLYAALLREGLSARLVISNSGFALYDGGLSYRKVKRNGSRKA